VSLDQLPGASVRGRPPNDTRAPRGPEAVRRAVLDSAAELFSTRGVAAVTMREVAADARVHPSLIHRYVGGKDAVLSAVLADLVDQLRHDLPAFAERADQPLPPALAQVMLTHQRIVTHLVIEGRNLADYQFEYPVMDHIIAEMQRIHGIDAGTARRRGALVYAHDVALRLFLPVLLAAVGLQPDDADDLRQAGRLVNLRISSGSGSGAA
jgi:AcrR family transcriptional regulator